MYPETSFECQKSQGTSSAAFLTGDHWGSWDGRLVVGIMGIGFGGTPVGQRIDVIRLSEDGKSAEEVVTLPFPSAALLPPAVSGLWCKVPMAACTQPCTKASSTS